MIDPQHGCYWSQKRLTRIKFNYSALSGAGVPLRVLAHALPHQDAVWYSKVYGEFNDNVILVGIDRDTADSAGEGKPNEATLFSAALGNAGTYEEYGLSAEIEARLGIVCDEDQYSFRDGSLVKWRVYIHDDCFFSVKPKKPSC